MSVTATRETAQGGRHTIPPILKMLRSRLSGPLSRCDPATQSTSGVCKRVRVRRRQNLDLLEGRG
jgi:hypothetical protein